MLLAERYRMDAPLGHGAMGQVWRAHDEILHRSLAVKVLPSAACDEVARERFRVGVRAGSGTRVAGARGRLTPPLVGPRPAQGPYGPAARCRPFRSGVRLRGR